MPAPTDGEDRQARRRAGNCVACRGIRGAITVDSNHGQDILAASRELLEELVAANDVQPEDVAAVFFTTTLDLNAEYPARAAREMGWTDTPLLCGHEMDVPGGLASCLRILLLVNTEKRADQMVHVYLKEARVLRPDRDNHPQG
jgi:chorismate mutase